MDVSQPDERSIRLVIADDHTLFRQGIRELLGGVPGLDVLAEGATGDEAIALTAQFRPDLLLLDVEMPGPGPRAVLRRVAQINPHTRIVILTMHEESVLVHELLKRGAAAYLVKTIACDELVAALRSVCRDQSSVLLRISRGTFEGLDQARPETNPLSAREHEVLCLAAEALSNTEIAHRLFIAEGTVKRHLTNIYAKLGAVSRIDAIRKAAAARLLPAIDDDDQPSRHPPPAVLT
ncbi:response regulator [Plantactinospora soyae]|uniref:DNA-binding NarL/FixJ family response regulator n=1 Tax=Plantactinospora soyae TaxID=1544732 RepID=A0A927R978_9ACTN|nr:response regulator transcription factor [Plantactinospora soyae]MBE1489511.1 DNA-binding NarL/FixJ family response regulator [Plantactinospora soyae]